MNRFFRTAYATTLVYLCSVFFGVLFTRVSMPFPAFSCLYFGLLVFLLPGMSRRLAGKEWLFYVIGAITAVLGFLPIALWHCPMMHWLIHLSGIAAAAVFLSVLRHRTTHRFFLEKFKFTVILAAIIIGLACFVMRTVIFPGTEVSERYEAVSMAMNSIVPYAIVLLASGVLLLRGLRAQPGRAVDEQAFNRRQLRDTLIFAILTTLVFAVDPFSWLGKAVSFLLNELLRPSFRFLAQAFASLMRFMSIWRQLTGDKVPTEETSDPRPVPEEKPAEMEAEQAHFEENDASYVFDYIYMAIIVLILLVILVVQVRRLARYLRKRSRNGVNGYPNETYESLPAEKEMRRKGKLKRRNSDPRERIRYLYGEFLNYLHKRHVEFGRTNTCGEIRHDAEEQLAADPPVLSGLTSLYEKARYRMEEAPTEADAQAMKDMLDRIKKREQLTR